MTYKHGIEVAEKATSLPSPLSTRYGVQIVFGTAPINLTKNPEGVVHKPILVSTYEEAVSALGYSDDWDKYTLCQSMYASFRAFQVSPVIFVNVLDPSRHTKMLDEVSYPVENHQVIINEQGVLRDTVVVSAQVDASRTGDAVIGNEISGEAATLVRDKDYIVDFDSAGRLIITLLTAGTAYAVPEVTVAGMALAPDLVTEEDIIGGYNAETGTETGFEIIRQIYPRFGIAPGIMLAPRWSEKPNIGAAMQSKCLEINGVFRCMCLLDLDVKRARKYTDCESVKREWGYDGDQAIVLWPRIKKEGKDFCFSAVYGAMMSYYTAENDDVPYLYPSNKELYVDGAVLDDGTEVLLDQVQAGVLNGVGVVTAIHDTSWKSYGNNTGCFPENTDPKDRWIGCRRMFDYVIGYFATSYRSELDSSMNRRSVDNIVNSFNIWGNSLTAAGRCAGLYAEYREDENPIDDILNGRLKLDIHFAPYTPVEYINATMEFDVSALESAMAKEE